MSCLGGLLQLRGSQDYINNNDYYHKPTILPKKKKQQNT